MANPNIVNVTTITGQTALANVTTVTANVITNASASGTICKINNIILSNYTGVTQSANVIINRSGSGSFYIAGTVTVPLNSTLVLVGKDMSFYLLEGDVIQSNASANSSIHLTSSYEIIS